MYFGADYYPEHWKEENWEKHADLMRQANINVVRLAEFAWSKIESQEGKFDFSWLDEAIDMLIRKGIKVVLGTPTAAPPKWMMDKHPDIYNVDEHGNIRGFGSRRHYCYNSKIFQQFTRKIVIEMAKHYKNNPHIVAWQIDNEFGGLCYCDNCLKAFKRWLKKCYGTVERMNEEWGTVFWSQTYRDWDEVILPRYTVCDSATPYAHNPGLLLDYRRFYSDSCVAYQKLQVDIIRKIAPAQPVTHNMMGMFNEIDYYKLGEDLDFVSLDNYPNNQWGKAHYDSPGLAADVMRGIKKQNFWVMEQQSGPCGWNFFGDTPKPGQLRLWTYQQIAHGADAIVYFRWRACLFGTEQYWYGILDHDGVPRRRYLEIQQTGKELQRLSECLVGLKVFSQVAIVRSYDCEWSNIIQSHNKNFQYDKIIGQYHRALTENHISTDIVNSLDDLSSYKFVIFPAHVLMTEEIKKHLMDYVTAGGNLLITYRSGAREWNNQMTTKALPGLLKELAGVEVEEFDSLNHGRTVKVMMKNELIEGYASVWCDILKTDGAEILATYAQDYFSGMPAITVNNLGNGKVYYVGSDLDQKFITYMIGNFTREVGVNPLLPEPVPNVEVMKRIMGGKEYLFILNHGEEEVSISIDGCELISNTQLKGMLILKPYDVAIVK